MVVKTGSFLLCLVVNKERMCLIVSISLYSATGVSLITF